MAIGSVDPDFGAMLCATHAAIAPGDHLNKRHWITVTLDGSYRLKKERSAGST